MRGRQAQREPVGHVLLRCTRPFDWQGDPEMAGPKPGQFTRRLSATMNALSWTMVLAELRKSDKPAIRKLGVTLERELHQ